MGVREGQEGRAAGAAGVDPGVLEHPADREERRDGMDGRNGWDGSSGSGGSITVTYDPAVAPYLGVIHLSNRGGPAPVFNEEPVAPLW